MRGNGYCASKGCTYPALVFGFCEIHGSPFNLATGNYRAIENRRLATEQQTESGSAA